MGQTARAQGISFDEASYTPEMTRFCLFAPDTASNVVVRIYADALAAEPEQVVTMSKTGRERFCAEIEGDLKGKFYTFDIGQGETPGVFAKAVGINGRRAAIIDLKETDPDCWDEDRSKVSEKQPCDRIIYELHHRDFSIDPSSGIEHKGKFLALTEPKAVGYLKALGINTVHILPSFDFATIDETRLDIPQYNWGYDPLNYNVPEGSYSTDPYNPLTRIREFKEMVKALHEVDIDVVLDVVYNHTNDIAGSNFQRTYPDYFYRKTADGTYSDGSGCGNETASEREGMRQFMIESMAYWMEEYHIDGFRVDLMGVHDIRTMNDIRSVLQERFGKAFIYGEGWSAGTCAYPQEKLAMKANIKQMTGIAAFCDDMRDALRGPFDDDHKGAFLAGIAGEEESLKFGIAGAIDHPQVDMTKVNYSKEAWTNEPSQMVAYVSCHDDMCLVDRLRTSVPAITDDELIRLDLLAQTAVLTSQGIPFILCGEEMLRDKKGVHNSYCSPDSINCLDWTNLERYPQVFDYYSRLISLRKNHPAFRLGKAEEVVKHLEFLPVKDNLVAFRLSGNAGGDEWKDIIVILNASKEVRKVAVPRGKYTVVCKNLFIDENGLETVKGKQVTVPAQSAMILHD
ncbi:MAG: type I pullulanase [Prevotella sp.]|nr:type I pullulanase [Prevotella sp.]